MIFLIHKFTLPYYYLFTYASFIPSTALLSEARSPSLYRFTRETLAARPWNILMEYNDGGIRCRTEWRNVIM